MARQRTLAALVLGIAMIAMAGSAQAATIVGLDFGGADDDGLIWNTISELSGSLEPGTVVDAEGNALAETTATWKVEAIDAVAGASLDPPAAPPLSETSVLLENVPYESYDVRVSFEDGDASVFEDITEPNFTLTAQGAGLQPAISSVEILGAAAPVPEPSTCLLAVMALAGLAVYRRRRK